MPCILRQSLFSNLSGRLSDRFSRDSVTGLILVAGVIGYGLLAQPVSFPVLVGAILLTGIAMTWGAPIQSQLMDQLGDTEQGIGFGLVRTIYLLIGALGSYVTGILITEMGWPIAFSLLSGVLVLCLVLIIAPFILRVGSSKSSAVH